MMEKERKEERKKSNTYSKDGFKLFKFSSMLCALLKAHSRMSCLELIDSLIALSPANHNMLFRSGTRTLVIIKNKKINYLFI